MATRVNAGGDDLPVMTEEAASVERIETDALERALTEQVRGEVRFDRGSRGMYATDASSYRQVPIGVVLPLDADDVRATLRIAREHGAPILGRGGGTSLAGQCCNHAVVLDFSKYMNAVLEVNPEERWVRVEPGCVLDELRDAVAPWDLTFGPDPATHSRCTLGGMIGNNSCGVHSVMSDFYGPGPRTEDQVLELTVVTYDGEELTLGPMDEDALEAAISAGDRRGRILADLRDLGERYQDLIRERFPDIPRRVSGYNLPALLPDGTFDPARALVGTESTCVIILEARLRLIPRLDERALLVLGYGDAYEAGDHVPEIMAHKPVGLEGMDDRLAEFMRMKDLHVDRLDYLPAGAGWLLVEFGANTLEEAETRARALMRELEEAEDPPVDMVLYTDPADMNAIWEVRESGLGATAFVPGMKPTWEGWEDAAVDPKYIGTYLREFRDLLQRYDYDAALYGHFGQGCVHCRIDFDYQTRKGLDDYMAFIDEAADLVVRYGGALSGEHGDGQSRGQLLHKMYGHELVEAFREFKRIWDPDWKMNPGKIVDAYAPDENLFLGVDWNPPEVDTHFRFPDDNHSFAHATLRCVGVGQCRRHDGGTMCPSYMVTREEKHSTRGRARLLQEMMRGDVITDGWKSEEVKDALDLCMSCKGCAEDCPVDVDVATYKSEFLSHYYEGRLRPRHAYAMGLIYWWARIASRAPGLVNAVMRAPLLGTLLKKIGGIHPDREAPTFASQTFRDWFARSRSGNGMTASVAEGRKVILWPDTFNNFFRPNVARAAVEVLEGAGFRPVLPEAMLCCGRPLYDFGMLDLAKRQLRQILDALRDEIRDGTLVVGLEPSCVATFRDELTALFPHDQDARRLSAQTLLLSELLEEFAPDVDLGSLAGETAVVHGHCHHKSVLGTDAADRVLARVGLDYDVLDSGCCGMAGPFGFQEEHYDVAQACGERVLLPAVREADPRSLVITDGFSCREMIEQNGLRRPLHTAEVLHMAMQREGLLPDPPHRELHPRRSGGASPVTRALVGAGAGVLAFRAIRAVGTLFRRE